ncbi:MAG TPA: hypothetical protein VM145_05470, partial [Sphingomicrobium sp.]|nr:hypothetical protein [Sphingomicrobium sp.]
EIIQFTTVTALGAGRFQLTGVRRGLEGTAVADHPEGEPFVLIERGALRPINLPAWLPGSPVQASTRDGRASCSLIARIKGRGPIRSKLKL